MVSCLVPDRALGQQAPWPPGSRSSKPTFQKCEQPGCEGIWQCLLFSPRGLTFEHPRALAPGQPSAHRWSGAAVAVVASVVFLTAAPPRGPRQDGLVENTGKGGG